MSDACCGDGLNNSFVAVDRCLDILDYCRLRHLDEAGLGVVLVDSGTGLNLIRAEDIFIDTNLR